MRADTGETDLRGGFPETRASAVAGVRSADVAVRERSRAAIVTVYWKPVYKYLRLRWGEGHESAQDLTQEFFARAFGKEFFERFDDRKARFRTFLRTCVDALVAKERQASQRLKRGGGAITLSLDFEGAEAELGELAGRNSSDLETVFDREWVRSLFATAIERLQTECESSGKSVEWKLFARYDLEDNATISYDSLARDFGITVTSVTNQLAAMRREFRRLVLDTLRELTASDEEFRLEARALFRKFEAGGLP